MCIGSPYSEQPRHFCNEGANVFSVSSGLENAMGYVGGRLLSDELPFQTDENLAQNTGSHTDLEAPLRVQCFLLIISLDCCLL